MKTPQDFPRLEGWITVTEAALILGVSRQACHKMIEKGLLTSVRCIGSSRPIYVLSEKEVREVKKLRGKYESK